MYCDPGHHHYIAIPSGRTTRNEERNWSQRTRSSSGNSSCSSCGILPRVIAPVDGDDGRPESLPLPVSTRKGTGSGAYMARFRFEFVYPTPVSLAFWSLLSNEDTIHRQSHVSVLTDVSIHHFHQLPKMLCPVVVPQPPQCSP
jgi:hypothetical protein